MPHQWDTNYLGVCPALSARDAPPDVADVPAGVVAPDAPPGVLPEVADVPDVADVSTGVAADRALDLAPAVALGGLVIVS